MKKIIILICYILSVSPLLAQGDVEPKLIHWLLFIDTEDEDVGQLDVVGRNVLCQRFVNVVDAALGTVGYSSVPHNNHGPKCRPEYCTQEIRNLQCGKNDIVVFYYIGHGARSDKQGNDHLWPQMCLGQHDYNKYIDLEWVHNELKKKNPRMLLTIGMCCNKNSNIPTARVPAFAVNYEPGALSEQKTEQIKKMFLAKQGDILATSASPDQYSHGCTSSYGDLDLFTCCFVDAFKDCLAQNKLNWQNLFTMTKSDVADISSGKQVPIFRINLQNSNPPPVSRREDPGTNPGNQNNDFASLPAMLDYISDSNVALSNRRSKAQLLERSVFTTDAVVKVLGQDANNVVDMINIADYLGIIGSSTLLLKVAVVDYKIRGGKISELNVKEIYKGE